MPTTLVSGAKAYPQPDGGVRVTATLTFPDGDGSTEAMDETYTAAQHADVLARLAMFENPADYAEALAGQSAPQVDDADVADFFALWQRNVRLPLHAGPAPAVTPIPAPDISG